MTAPLHGPPTPGFMVLEDQLPNEVAFTEMMNVGTAMTNAALAARLGLLRLGFSTDHSLCRELDETARQYTVVFEVGRRQLVNDRFEDVVDAEGRL